MGQESGSHLAGILCLKVSHKAAIKLLAKATVISRFNQGRIHFQALVVVVRPWVPGGCWLEVSVPLPFEPLLRAAHNMAAGFSQNK